MSKDAAVLLPEASYAVVMDDTYASVDIITIVQNQSMRVL
jgi:hypothetical protein